MPTDQQNPARSTRRRIAHRRIRNRRLLQRWSAPALAFIIVAYIFAFRYLPLQDYPDWLYQGVIFREFLRGNTFDGFFSLQPYVPPNATSTILIGLLSFLLHPQIAGKIVLAAGALLLFFGIIRYFRHVSGRRTLLGTLLAFLFVFNANFWLGNLNFTIGLGIALLGFQLMVELRWMEKTVVAALLFLGAYLTHFFAYAILLYAVAIWMIVDRPRISFWRLLLVNLPALLLLAHFVAATSTGAPGSGFIQASTGLDLRQRISLFAGVLVPFQRMKGVYDPALPFQVVNYAVAAGLALLTILVAVRSLRSRRRPFALMVAAPLPLVILVLPLAAAGIVRPGERLVLFFALNLLAVAIVELPRIVRPLTLALIPLCLASFIYYVDCTATFNTMIESEMIPPRETLDALASRGGSDGFLRLPYYAAITTRQPMPIFTSGLFTYTAVDSLDRAR